MNRAPVIIAAARTAIGTTGGMFANLDTTDLAAPVVGRLARGREEQISEVVLGNVRGPGGNPARLAALAAGLAEVPALTLDRQCGSGMAALEYAYHRLRSESGFVIAGGVQAASTQPITTWPPGHPRSGETYIRAPFAPPPWDDPELGLAADLLAEECGVTRERQDAYALRSHQRALESRESGVFDAEIIEVAGHAGDERPRAFTAQRLAKFRPAFRDGGTVTAANCCGVNDAAAAVLMVDGETFERLGIPGLRVLGAVSATCNPDRPGWGIVPAVEKLGRPIGTDTLIEFNEAFAGQVLACADALGIDEHRICPQGGAIGLGHPWAASGAVLAVRLFSQLVGHERKAALQPGRLGLAAIAIGGGMGSALLVRAC